MIHRDDNEATGLGSASSERTAGALFEAGEDKEIKGEATELQQALTEFARLSALEQAKVLPDFINTLKDKERINEEILSQLAIPEVQDSLNGNVMGVSTILAKTPEGDIPLWYGGATLVQLDGDGQIEAYAVYPDGEVYKSFGNNLLPYALQKAVILMHRRKANLGGVEHRHTRKHLESQYGWRIGKDYYQGAAAYGARAAYIGASGCEMDHGYRASLLPKDTELVGDGAVSFMAGVADELYAKQVVYSMEHADKPIVSPIEEPEFFEKFRASH